MTSLDFSSFLDGISKYPLPVLDASIPLKKYISLDLSVYNEKLNHLDVSSSLALEQYINNHMVSNNALVAYGGYNEIRNIYRRSDYFNQSDQETERNIHIGMDLWLPADSPIFAPLDATVHSFQNNTNHGDYGPTIILKHEVDDIVFYTLYGHLSLISIANLKKGQIFNQGEQIATLGDATINGDYSPHLHFQIIKDMEGYQGDYPGVCRNRDLKYYLENCPDPNLVLKLQ